MTSLLQNKSRTKVVVLTTLALVAVLFLGPGCATQAATDDPNMTAYNGQFTVLVDVEDGLPATANLQAVPADVNYSATTFDSEADAAAVEWSFVTSSGGLSEEVLPLGTETGETDSSGVIYSNQVVTVSDEATPGVASFLAVNPNGSDPSVNITLVLDDSDNYDSAGTTVSNIVFQIFEPTTAGSPSSAGVTTLHSGTLPSVAANLNTDSHAYVTVFDAVAAADAAGIINDYDIEADSVGNYLDSVTINGNAYEADPSGYPDGWLYQVYELDGATYEMVELSQLVGAGDFSLSDGQLIQFQYGAYGSVTFPNSFPNPGFF